MTSNPSILGKPTRQVDAIEKAVGRATFTADIVPARMLTASVVRSPIAHGVLRHIDLGRARWAPGVRVIVTGSDVSLQSAAA